MCVSVLLNVVNYYGVSVLSMSVMGFPKQIDSGGWGDLSPLLFGFLKCCHESRRELSRVQLL